MKYFKIILLILILLAGGIYYWRNRPEKISEIADNKTECLEIKKKNIEEGTYSLSNQEWENFIKLMGIDSVCIPSEFGQPVFYVDWDQEGGVAAAKGRRFVIGFENLLISGDISSGTIIYSTYNFALSGEARTYAERDLKATLDDLNEIKNKPYVLQVDGFKGYANYTFNDTFNSIRKEIFFPFKEHYIAITYNLKGDYSENYSKIIEKLYRGEYPVPQKFLDEIFLPKNYKITEENGLKLFDGMVSSLNFSENLVQ
jgi:hypothetical protein